MAQGWHDGQARGGVGIPHGRHSGWVRGSLGPLLGFYPGFGPWPIENEKRLFIFKIFLNFKPI
jgi:hypothetical protein